MNSPVPTVDRPYPTASRVIQHSSGFKYRLEQPFWYKWKNPLPFKKEFHGQYYEILDFSKDEYDWWLHCFIGFGWDGPSGPMVKDRRWRMVPAIPHDVGHWQIEIYGNLPESANDLLDKEYGDCVRQGKEPIEFYLGGERSRKFHAWKDQKGTNIVDGRYRGKRRITRILV